MFLFLLVQLTLGDMFESFDEYLNPGDIFYPTLSWSATPTFLTSNHAGDKINITLYFYTQVPLIKGYFATLAIGYDTPFETTIEEDQSAIDDNNLTFYNIIFPTAKTYGPLRLIIYSSKQGQIIASCVSYGSISIAPSRPSPGSLKVIHSDVNFMILQRTQLEFSVKLTQETADDDYLELDISDGYALEENFTLTIQRNNQEIDYYKEENGNLINVYLEGLVLEKGDSINITINGFKNPLMDGMKVYYWTLCFYRFGTRTIKQWFNGTGPAEPLVYPSVVITSWKASNGAEKVAVGSTLYMDFNFNFNVKNYILLGCQVFFEGVDISTKSFAATSEDQSDFSLNTDQGYCGVISNVSDDSYVMCTTNGSLLVAIVLFSNQSSVTYRGIFKILSKNANLQKIVFFENQPDNSLSIASLTTELTSKPTFFEAGSIDGFRVYFEDEDSIVTSKIGSDVSKILIEFNGPVNIVKGEKITIALPLSKDSGKLEYIQYYDISYTLKSTSNDQSGSVAATVYDDNKLDITLPFNIIKDESVTITLTSSETFILPYIPSDTLTKYEAMIEYIYKEGTVNQATNITFNPIYFVANNMDLKVSPLFKSAELDGIPIQIQMTFPLEFIDNHDKFVDIEITSTTNSFKKDLGSGIKSNFIFPSKGLEGKVSIIYSSNNFLSTLRVTFDNFTENSEKFVIPFLGLESEISYEFVAYAKVKLSSTRIITLFKSSTVTLKYDDVKSSDEIPSKENISFNETLSELTISVDLSSSNPEKTGSFAVSFPSNFRCDSMSFGDTKIEFKNFNISTDQNNQYLFGYSDFSSTGTTVNVIFYNLIIPWYSGDFKINLYIGQDSISNSFSSESPSFIKKYLSLSVVSADLSIEDNCEAVGLGPSSQLINITFDFTVSSDITIDQDNQTSMSFKINENLQLDSGFYSILINEVLFEGLISYVSSIKLDSPLKQINKNSTISLSLINMTSPSGSVSKTSIIKEFSIFYKTNTIAKIFDEVTCNITENKKIGVSVINEFKIFPNQRDTLNLGGSVYFSIKVNFSLDIPAGSNITLIGHKFRIDENARANTWCSHIASAVVFTSEGYLSITNLRTIPKDSIFELRKDVAFNITANLSVTHTGYFLFNVTYQDILIIYDSEKTDDRRIKYLDNISVNFSSLSISASRYNQGELEYYTFSFRLKNDTKSNWAYVIDIPGSYDAHFGNATVDFPDKNSEVYYLRSKSSLAKIKCSVDHWIVICTGFEVIQAGSSIDISLRGYTPPRTKSEDFFIYIVDKDDLNVIHAITNGNLDNGFTSIPGDNLDLISVSVEYPDMYLSDYVFTVSFNGKYVNGSVVMFLFPIQYHLERDNPDKVNCSAIYNGAYITSNQTNCSVEGKFITYKFTSVIELFGKVIFILKNIMNPFYAWNRPTSSFPDFKKQDFYFWTQKFEVYSILVDASTATGYDYKSYMNRNAAYAGFYKREFEEFLINDYGPGSIFYALDGCPGLLSPPVKISVKDDKLLAQNLTLKLSEYYNLILFDKSEYVLTFEQPFTYFRMKIPTNPKTLGMFYISIDVEEYPLINQVYRYGIPTKIPVYLSLDYAVKVYINESFDYLISNGKPSLPIKIDLGDSSPESNITMLIVDCEECTPNELVFKQGSFFKFFNFTITNDDSSTIELNIKISGTDKSSFNIDQKINLIANRNKEVSSDNSFKVERISKGMNDFAFHLQINKPDVVYWVLGSKRYYDSYPEHFNISFVKENTYDPNDYNSSAGRIIQKQAESFNKYINRLLSLYEDYEEFTFKLVEYAEKKAFYGAEVLGNYSVEIGPYNILIPGVEYILIVYNQQGDSNKTIIFNNTEIPGIEIITDLDNSDDFVNLLVKSSGFPSYRFKTANETKLRRLKTSQSFYAFSSPRFGFDSKRILNDIENNNSSEIKISSESLERNKNMTSFNNDHRLSIYKDTTLRLYLSANNSGKACCIIEQNPNINQVPKTYDIFFGYGRDRKPAFRSQCKDVTENNKSSFMFEWDFKGDNDYDDYTLSCCYCNNYPVIPQCDSELVVYELKWVEPQVSFALLVLLNFWQIFI